MKLIIDNVRCTAAAFEDTAEGKVSDDVTTNGFYWLEVAVKAD